MDTIRTRIAALSAGIACLMLFTGCALPQRQVRILDVTEEGSSAITYPADLRGAYVLRPNGVRVCAEPAPDVALDSLEKITANLEGTMASGDTIKGSVATEFATKVVELAGRTQLVLVARELLFRACELSLNHPGNPQDAITLYMKAAEVVTSLGKADEARAEAQLQEAQAAALNAGSRAADKILGTDE